jgi:hypothetical protein
MNLINRYREELEKKWFGIFQVLKGWLG